MLFMQRRGVLCARGALEGRHGGAHGDPSGEDRGADEGVAVSETSEYPLVKAGDDGGCGARIPRSVLHVSAD